MVICLRRSNHYLQILPEGVKTDIDSSLKERVLMISKWLLQITLYAENKNSFVNLAQLVGTPRQRRRNFLMTLLAVHCDMLRDSSILMGFLPQACWQIMQPLSKYGGFLRFWVRLL